MEKARTDYLKWEEYFMAIVKLSSLRSKDPSTQVGAIIVNEKMQIIGTGYNGFPRGLDDNIYPWTRDDKSWEDTKYPYVVHAEANAILNSIRELDGTSIFVSLFPCNECAKLIIQAGIKNVYYISDKYNGSQINNVARKLFKNSKVEFKQLPDVDITINNKVVGK